MNYDIKEVIQDLNGLNAIESPALVSEADSETLVKEVASKHNSEKQAFGLICIICQNDGTRKKAQGTVYAILNATRLTLTNIRDIIKSKNLKITLRQWARSNSNAIHEISNHFSIPGDLAKKISRTNNELSQDDLYWLSNFKMDNPNCPEHLRQLLYADYSELFPNIM